MRLSSLFLCLALGCATASATEVKIVRLLPEYLPASEFVRISEYFGGKENTRGATILRTKPESRDGFYFNLRVESPAAVELVWAVLEIITPTANEPRVESFAVSLPRGSHLIRLGLTGTDWPSPKARPLAWKIRLLGVDGAELAKEQSYLWSKPDSATPPTVN
jgi:hypothetical protein